MTKAEWIGQFVAQLGTRHEQVMEEMKRPLPRIGGPGYKWYRPGKQEEWNEQNSVG